MTTYGRPEFPALAPELREFRWPPENEVGGWESLDPWPCPLGGVVIEKERDHIQFQYREPFATGRGPLELASADFQMLKDFADLCTGDAVADGRLFRFASRYGALGLCKLHGWPFAHTRPHCPSNREDGNHRVIESIQAWLKFSRLARAIITPFVTSSSAEREREIAILRSYGDADPHRAILHWLQGSELKIWFRAKPARLTLYGVPPVWTALGLELATLAVRTKGIILCSSCGRLDSLKNPRGNGARRSYCSKCRDKGRKRDAAVDLRNRKKRVRALRSQEKSIAEIVRETGFSAAQVRRYLPGEK